MKSRQKKNGTSELYWKLRGYHNAYSLQFAILDEISNNISMVAELTELFAEQNSRLREIENQLEKLLVNLPDEK